MSSRDDSNSREGAVLGPVQIKTIYREMIEIQFGEQTFLLRAN